jgi:uncharacterized protein YegJ (DUF2314 family)
LPQIVRTGYGIYFDARTAGMPSDDDLKGIVDAWLISRAPAELRDLLRTFLAEPKMIGRAVVPLAQAPLPPARMLSAMRLGESEERILPSVTHCVMTATYDALRFPRIGLLAGWCAARAIAMHLRGLVFDPECGRIVPIARYDEPVDPNPWIPIVKQVMIPYSVDERGNGWMTTLGMQKYGLPNMEIRDIPAALSERLSLMVSGLAHALARQVMRLNQDRQGVSAAEFVIGPDVRIDQRDVALAFGGDPKEPADGVRGWTTVRLGYHPKPKGRELLLGIMSPSPGKVAPGIWLYQACEDLWGSGEQVGAVKKDSESMEIASRRALAELPGALARFEKGLPIGAVLYIKRGFVTARGGDDREYMWIAVKTVAGDALHGILANDPVDLSGLRAGQAVTIPVAGVFDWMITHDDGTQEGGYTTAVLKSEGLGLDN